MHIIRLQHFLIYTVKESYISMIHQHKALILTNATLSFQQE